jgi:hypothetical protein
VNDQLKHKCKEVLEAYQNFSADKIPQPAFWQAMQKKGFEAKAGHANVRYFHGIGLRVSGQDREESG